MLIQLKQTEIVTALKQYIAQQGINLTNKDVKITFTAGRKESGISADMEIEELEDIPGYTDADEPEAVQAKKSADVHQIKVVPLPVIEATEEEAVAEPSEEAPKPPTPSLFGN